MKFRHPLVVALAAIYALFAAARPSHCTELGRVTNLSGKPPATFLVEQPQDALKLWHSQGQKGRTLILISEDLPLYPLDGESADLVLKDMSEGRWDEILGKDYKTARYYPVGRSNYIYAAYNAGMISRVYWVPPTKETVGEEPIENIRNRFASLAGESGPEKLEKDGKAVSGTINGIPVYICNLRDIPAIAGETILAVDLTFFTVLYKDEVRTPFLELLASFMQTLGSSGLKASDAVISYSTSLDVVPLQQRFIGRYLKKFLSDPESLSGGPPAAWLLRAQGMHYDTFFQVEEALDAYSKAVDIDPKDASLRFDLALSYFSEKNAARMKEELDTAVSLDRGYYPAYISYGKYLADKGLTLDAESFLDEAEKAEPYDPEVWKAKRDVMRASGKYGDAVEAQKRYIALGYDGAEPFYQLAQDYADLGEYGPARDNYLKSLGMLPVVDTTLRPLVLLGLAESYEKTGNIQEALDTYESALDTTADQHSKTKIYDKYQSLKKKWEPFMKGGNGN